MRKWNIGVTATLDKPIPVGEARDLAARIGGDGLAFATTNDDRFGVSVHLDSDEPFGALERLRGAFVGELRRAEYSVVAWEAAELFSPAEVERRIAAARTPELVNTTGFAELLGVSQPRVSELEAERKKAAAEGREYPFPAPMVPGWWVKAGAERYAANRRGPGRPKRAE